MRSDIFLKFALAFLIILNLADNVIASWLHKNLADPDLALKIIYIKYAVFGVFFLGFIVDIGFGAKLRRYEWSGLVYLGSVLVISIAIMTTHSDYSSANRLYMYYFPPIIYFSGCFFGRRSNFTVAYVIKTSTMFYLFAALIFAILNIIIGPVQLWRDNLAYASFILDAKGFSDAIIDGLHGNFYYYISGRPVPRFVGSYGDPLSISYAGVVLLAAAYFAWPRHRIVFCSALFIIIMASLTRAVLLTLPIAAFIFWFFGKRGFDVTLAFSMLLVFIVAAVGENVFSLTENSSAAAHVLSVSDIFNFLNPQSFFVGALVSGKMPEFEPGLLNILFTYGFLPFALFLSFVRGIYLRNAAEGSLTPYLSVIMLIAILTLSVISSVFFATTSSWFAWFLAGFASKRSFLALPENGQGTERAVPHPQVPGVIATA